jgi:two-component system, probable response regulator PhcQ
MLKGEKMSGPFTILLVDDEAPIRKALKRVLKYEPYTVLETGDPNEAVGIVQEQNVHLVLSDHTMPGMLGIDLLRKIRLIRPDTIRIILTGNANLDMALQAINEGAIYRFLTKPWDNNELLLAIRLGLRQWEMEDENRRLLAQVKKQGDMLSSIELEHPGITGLKKTEDGKIVLDEHDIEEALAELDDLEQTIPEIRFDD